jgi:Leucine-rich repeat (LRR) protein
MHLETVLLNNNNILDITGYVTQMDKLRFLDLSHNTVPTVVPLHRIASLRYLYLRSNKVRMGLTRLSSAGNYPK